MGLRACGGSLHALRLVVAGLLTRRPFRCARNAAMALVAHAVFVSVQLLSRGQRIQVGQPASVYGRLWAQVEHAQTIAAWDRFRPGGASSEGGVPDRSARASDSSDARAENTSPGVRPAQANSRRRAVQPGQAAGMCRVGPVPCGTATGTRSRQQPRRWASPRR